VANIWHQICSSTIRILIIVRIRTLRGRNACRAYWNILAASELRCELNFADLFLRKDLAHVREAMLIVIDARII